MFGKEIINSSRWQAFFTPLLKNGLMKNTLQYKNRGIQQKLFSLFFLIPCSLFAQDRWSDGLYSTPDIRIVKRPLAVDKSTGPILIATYSPKVKISRTDEMSEFPRQVAFNVYPNPVISDTRAIFTSQENGLQYQVYMVSVDGKPLLRKTGTTVNGTNTINLNMSSYPTGTYNLQLIIGNRREIIRVIKAVR